VEEVVGVADRVEELGNTVVDGRLVDRVLEGFRLDVVAVGFLLVGFLLALVGFLLVDFLLVDFLLVGFLLAGFLLAGFLLAGFLLAGFLLALVVDAWLVIEELCVVVTPVGGVVAEVALGGATSAVPSTMSSGSPRRFARAAA
jgi:hypothetical protein